MNRFATKFAASTMVLAITMVGCHSDSTLVGAATASTSDRSDRQARRLHEQARAASERGDKARAVSLAERAVELSPRDLGHRMLLADLYLRSGRFASAETSYGDVLTLDPANERAAISIALTQIAQGRNGDAVAELEAIAGTAPASDVGLAFALAGQPQRAIELLEPAARSPEANGRVRQNLALAYAIAGDWQRARTVAAQDVSPADLGARLQQWAALARPSAPGSQVAVLLGVTPQADPGQPVRLALGEPVAAPAQEPQAYAEAEPAPEPAAEPVRHAEAVAPDPAPAAVQVAEAAPVENPIRYADLIVAPAAAPADTGSWWPAQVRSAEVRAPEPVPAPLPAPVVTAALAIEAAPVPIQVAMPVPAPAPAPVVTPVEQPVVFAAAPAAPVSVSAYVPAEAPATAIAPAEPVRAAAPAPAKAVPSIRYAASIEPRSAVLRPSTQVARAVRPTFMPAAPRPRAAVASIAVPRAGSSGRFVVQIGAFSNVQNAERAWADAERRFGLATAEPRTTTIAMGGRTLHRVSVGGFADRTGANRVCASIKARGGTCFVRESAGDAPVRWASRSARNGRA